MRMQNAEMEFVTFDAQDILTTSGPGPVPDQPKNLLVTQATAYAYNTQVPSPTEYLKSKSGVGITDKKYKDGTQWLEFDYDGKNPTWSTGAKDDKPTGDFYEADKDHLDLITWWLENYSSWLSQ